MSTLPSSHKIYLKKLQKRLDVYFFYRNFHDIPIEERQITKSYKLIAAFLYFIYHDIIYISTYNVYIYI